MEAMNWSEVILYAIETLLGLIISVGIPFLFNIIRAKLKAEIQIKYLNKFEGIVSDAVTQVEQTYVSEMRKHGLFDKDAQAEAFKKAKDAVLAMMNEETKKIVTEAIGDFDEYLRNKIETEVYTNKNNMGVLTSVASAE